MKKYTITELQDRFKDLLKKESSILCTEDGQAFYNNAQGKNHANNHAANVKVKVFEVKAGKTETKKETKKTKK